MSIVWKGLLYTLLIDAGQSLVLSRPSIDQTRSLFDWKSIQPSPNLVWHDCYHHTISAGQTLFTIYPKDDSHSFRCARLSAPLDWLNASNPNTITIAIIKLPAQHRQDVPEPNDSVQFSRKEVKHGGTIFFNPGGPGGSGVDFLLRSGHKLQAIVNGQKHFDMLSFDPRGVGLSTNARCIDDILADQLWDLRYAEAGELGMNSDVFAAKIAYARGRAQLCAAQKYNNSNDNIRAYLSTASVARDMLEIAGKDSAHRPDLRADERLTGNSAQPSQRNSDVRLHFIGQSYGTMLGITFASMYPNHVGKMLLDGNFDADDWTRKWPTSSVLDFEELMSSFFQRCFATKQKCDLWRPADVDSGAIKIRFEKALREVRNHPIPVHSRISVDLVTYSEVKLAIYSSAYEPGALPILASFLNGINERKISSHLPWLAKQISCSSRDPFDPRQFTSHDAQFATTCGDAESLANSTMTEFEQYLAELAHQSPNAGPISSEWRLPCMVWPESLRPRWRFKGPFGSNHRLAHPPILFLNNRLDPVCPIRNARRMAKKFPGSVVLEQDAVGHGAIGAALSNCTIGYIKSYFNNGILPHNGALCPGRCQPFDEACSTQAKGALDLLF